MEANGLTVSEVNGNADVVGTYQSASQVSIPANMVKIKVYKKRFLILALFCCFSMINAFQWIQYSIITSIITEYYEVSEFAVNWTSVIYMAVYIPGIIPASWILDKKGLRFVVILGSAINCIGAWVKCASISPKRFPVTMVGQSLSAIAQLFILNLPPRIAALWFEEKEVSRATAAGVFGNQVGIALGFVLSPLIVTKSKDKIHVGNGLTTLFIGVAIISTILLLLKIFLFEDKPINPPSHAAASAEVTQADASYFGSIKSLVRNRNYMILFLTYGINVGVFYAVSTLLNQLVTSRFGEHVEQDAGYMGLIMTVAGTLGSIAGGYILDTTHRYKETTTVVYLCSFFGMLAFTGALRLSIVWPLFIISGVLGFFMTGYLPIGFEFAAEISYPQPEGTSAGLLNASAQIFGIIYTLMSSAILSKYGDLVTNSVLSFVLFCGFLITIMIKPRLLRQEAASKQSSDKLTEQGNVI